MRHLFTLFFLSTVWLFATPSSIKSLIQNSPIPPQDISLSIVETETNRVVASHNANTVRKPASVIKVMTTYAALLQFGFGYRWETGFYHTGRIKHGILEGDLYIKASGDPTLDTEDMESIAEKLEQQGIREIRGDLVIDRSHFSIGDSASAHFDAYPHDPYNAMPDALMFNERTSTVCITPSSGVSEKELEDPSYRLIDEIRYVNRACRGKYAWAGSRVDTSEKTPKLILSGELSRHCKERKVCKVISKPYKAFYYAMKEALYVRDMRLSGEVKLRAVPKDVSKLFIHTSDTLETILSTTSKESNNVYARHLLLELGAARYGAPATIEKGRKAVRALIEQQVRCESRCEIDNGSGLSRSSLVTARTLGEVLQSAYHRYGRRWMETFSIAGVDGTLKKQFRGDAAYQKAWMKTGTLNRVKNISGYVENKEGNLYSVVILINSKKTRKYAFKLQKEIINWLAETERAPAKNSDLQPIASGEPKDDQSKSVQSNKVASSKIHPKDVKALFYDDFYDNGKAQYYVQVNALSQYPTDLYLERIRQQGYRVEVFFNKGYKVQIGGYQSEKAARRALPGIRRKFNHRAFIVTR